jgi:YesN/AraC family two-component response regulator
MLQQAECLGLSPSDFRHLENFYQSIPLLPDETPLMMALTTLAETMWGTGNAYKIVDLKLDKSMRAIAPPPVYEQERNSVMQMRLMQQRYDFENELMDKVSKGLWHRVKLMLSVATSNPLEQRLADPLRNQKNYCIICNTLMRKAAEKGGVHPLHLDQLSSQYAQQIELLPNLRAGQNLISDMIQNYCRLVRRHNLKDYSPLIRKVITYVDAEISSNLSLAKLAKIQNVSPEYLSALFHKETGKTLTRFINEKRLEQGASLLQTSSLQVQTIAEYCGFPDAGYFAKVFKKHYGLSPKTYREMKRE